MISSLVRRAFGALVIVGAALGTLALSGAPASADVFTFQMRNSYPHIIELRFYSTSRTAVWPGGGRVWKMTTRDVQTYRLTCSRGEQVCFGASSGRTNWGVGRDRTSGCRGCCYTCADGAVTSVIDLRSN